MCCECGDKYLSHTGHLQTWIIPVSRLELERGEERKQHYVNTSEEKSHLLLDCNHFWIHIGRGRLFGLWFGGLRFSLWRNKKKLDRAPKGFNCVHSRVTRRFSFFFYCEMLGLFVVRNGHLHMWTWGSGDLTYKLITYKRLSTFWTLF